MDFKEAVSWEIRTLLLLSFRTHEKIVAVNGKTICWIAALVTNSLRFRRPSGCPTECQCLVGRWQKKRPRLLSLTCYRRVINVCKWAQGVRFDSWKLQWRVGVIYFLLLFLHSAAEVSIFTVVFFVCLVLLISIPSGWCSSMQISSGYRSQLLETERANWCHFEFQIESAEFLKSRIGLNIS